MVNWKNFLLPNKPLPLFISLGSVLLLVWYGGIWPARFDLSSFDLKKGAEIYNNQCIACHVTGYSGAPKIGHKKDWQARLDKGLEALFKSARYGLNAMPPRGGNPKLSDEEVKAAVAFMVSESW